MFPVESIPILFILIIKFKYIRWYRLSCLIHISGAFKKRESVHSKVPLSPQKCLRWSVLVQCDYRAVLSHTYRNPNMWTYDGGNRKVWWQVIRVFWFIFTFSFSMSSIFCCRADFDTSMDSNHWKIRKWDVFVRLICRTVEWPLAPSAGQDKIYNIQASFFPFLFQDETYRWISTNR